MQKIAVIGCNGFVGSYLSKELSSRNIHVIGIGRQKEVGSHVSKFIDEYYECDVLDLRAIENLPLDKVDALANLAGLTNVKESFSKRDEYLSINVQVHTNIIENIKLLNKKVRILATSSGIVYDSSQKMPVHENGKIITEGSPYALSKVLMEQSLMPYISSGMDIVIARPFNHTGPGQYPGFILPDLVKQIQDGDTLRKSPLNTSRDYTDVRDVVKAYSDLLTAPTLHHTVYNICSGKPTSRDELIEAIMEITQKKSLQIIVDESLRRPSDPTIFYGDSSRINDELHWRPTISLRQTIEDYIKQGPGFENWN